MTRRDDYGERFRLVAGAEMARRRSEASHKIEGEAEYRAELARDRRRRWARRVRSFWAHLKAPFGRGPETED
jgi:hypothetical protein